MKFLFSIYTKIENKLTVFHQTSNFSNKQIMTSAIRCFELIVDFSDWFSSERWILAAIITIMNDKTQIIVAATESDKMLMIVLME